LAAIQMQLGLASACEHERLSEGAGGTTVSVRLKPQVFERWCADFDTLDLRLRLAHGDARSSDDALESEIGAALFSAPERIDFDSADELAAHVRVRRNIALAAEKTALAFKTNDAAERPEDFWHHEDDVGFLLNPGQDLVDALVAATQPERTGRLYDFSCYRASEYVILLGLAQEALASSPALYAQLETTARERCIKSGLFHEVFLVEYGSLDRPVPKRFYVPGDRVWFKNPDEASSNASGYEGSWVIYMGGGLFSNFWKRDRPFTLEDKALEIYHWRHGLYLDANEPQINEEIVEARILQTKADTALRNQVLERMDRYRDPSGVYDTGGCMDTTREFPRQLGRIRMP
jgi:hypothetical protein